MDPIASLRPMLATPGRVEAVRVGFRHEIKWDGVRVLATVGRDGVTLRSRVGNDVTAGYPELAVVADRVPATTVLDAEIVALGTDGAASFAALQRRMHLREPARVAAVRAEVPVQLVVFDVLVVADEVVLRAPLEQRRRALEELALHGDPVQLPPTSDDLDTMLRVARTRGDEGVVSKRLGSTYRPGVRSADWVKLPFDERREVVVGGWRPERTGGRTGGRDGTRDGRRLGAVLVGAHDADGQLRYLGAVGSGLAGRAGQALGAVLEPSTTFPFVDEVPHADAVPCRATVVGTVRHRGLTGEGRLRQPTWLGVRDDVAPAQVVVRRA